MQIYLVNEADDIIFHYFIVTPLFFLRKKRLKERMKNPDASKKIGDLMLQGYTLLAQHCPRCNTPLVSKKGGDMQCCSCDATVLLDGNVPMSKSETPPANPEPIVPSSYEELRAEFQATNTRRESVSAKLGQMMLQGWAMLGTLCPLEDCAGTPLMRKQGDKGVMMCVACERTYAFDSDEQLVITNRVVEESDAAVAAARRGEANALHRRGVPVQAQNEQDEQAKLDAQRAAVRPVAVEVPTLPPPAPEESRSAAQGVDASATISRKLLQGWAMLDKVCGSEVCRNQVPLMRNRQGKTQCAVCEAGDDETKLTTSKASTTTQRADTGAVIDDDELMADTAAFVEYNERRKAEMQGNLGPATTITAGTASADTTTTSTAFPRT